MERPASPSGDSRSQSPGGRTCADEATETGCVITADRGSLPGLSQNTIFLEASTKESIGCFRLSSSPCTSRLVPQTHLAPEDSGCCCAAHPSVSVQRNAGDCGNEAYSSNALLASEGLMAAQSVRQTKTAAHEEEHLAANGNVLNHATPGASVTRPACEPLTGSVITSLERKGWPRAPSPQAESVRECDVVRTDLDLKESISGQAPQSGPCHQQQTPIEYEILPSTASLVRLESTRSGRGCKADEETASFTIDDKDQSCENQMRQRSTLLSADCHMTNWPRKEVKTETGTPCSEAAYIVIMSPVALQQVEKKQGHNSVLLFNHPQQRTAALQAEGRLSRVKAYSAEAPMNAGTTGSAIGSPGSTFVESASTSSVSVTSISKSVSSSFTGLAPIPLAPACLLPERRTEKEASPSQSGRESKCPVGSCEEITVFGSQNLTETHLGGTQIHSSRTYYASSDSTVKSPRRLGAVATGGLFSCARASRRTSPVLSESTRCFPTSGLETPPVPHALLAEAKQCPTASEATVAEFYPPTDRRCLPDEGGHKLSPLADKDSPAPTGLQHHSSGTTVCKENASHSRLHTESAFYKYRTGQPLGEHSVSVQKHNSEDPSWNEVASCEWPERVRPTPVVVPADSHTCSSSDPSACSSTACKSEAVSTQRRKAPHADEGMPSPPFARAPESSFGPAHSAAHTLPELSRLQQTTQQSSRARAEDYEEHYANSPQHQSVGTPSRIRPPQTEWLCQSSTKRELAFESRPPPPRKLDLNVASQTLQQQTTSSPSNGHPYVSHTDTSTSDCPRAEHAAYVLGELQQLQELLATGLVNGDSFSREGLQRRFCHLQNALQKLLYSGTDRADVSKETEEMRNQSAAQTSASCSSTLHPPAPQGLFTGEHGEAARPSRVVETRGNALAALSENAGQCVSPLEDYKACVSHDDGLSSSRRRLQGESQDIRDCFSPLAAHRLSPLAAVDEDASASGLLLSATTRSPCVAEITSESPPQQQRAAQESIVCLDGKIATREGSRERDCELNIEEGRTGWSSGTNCNASNNTQAAEPSTETLSRAELARLGNSASRQNHAAEDTSGEAAANGEQWCVRDTFALTCSVHPPATGKAEVALQSQDSPLSAASFPHTSSVVCAEAIGSLGEANTGQPACSLESTYEHPSDPIDERRFPPCASISRSSLCDAATSHAACKVESTGQHRSNIVEATDPPHRSSVSGHEEDSSRPRKKDNEGNQNDDSSPMTRRSPRTVSGPPCAHPEEPSYPLTSSYKPLKGMRARRSAKQSVWLRPRSGRRRSSGMGHICRGSRQPMPGRKLISKRQEDGEVERSGQTSHGAAVRSLVPQEGREAGLHEVLPSDEKLATPQACESGTGCSPCLRNGNMFLSPVRQEESSKHCQAASTEYTENRRSSLDKSSRLQSAEAQPTDSTSVSNKEIQLESERRMPSTAARNTGEDVVETSDPHTSSPSAVVQVPGQTETPRTDVALASLVDTELAQAMLSFVERQLSVSHMKDEVDAGEGLGWLPASLLRLNSAQKGGSGPAEKVKKAHSGLLLASCLGVVAGCGGFDIFKDLRKLLNSALPEQTSNEGTETMEKTEERWRSKGETSHATDKVRALASANEVLSGQNASTAARKTTVPPGGWTAGRAATRVAQKEHREHQKPVCTQDAMVDGAGHLHLSTSSLSLISNRSPTRKKTLCSRVKAPNAHSLRQSCKIATRHSSGEGGRIRWELLRTARRAAHRQEREGSIEGSTRGTKQNSKSGCRAENSNHKQEGNASTVSILLTPPSNVLPSSNDSSLCSSIIHLDSDKTGGISHFSSVDSAEIQSTRSQLSTGKKSPDSQQTTQLQRKPSLNGEDCSGQRVRASRSCGSLTDNEHFPAEELPSFEDIFNLPDLIPDAWYEEAEENGKAAVGLNLEENHSSQLRAEGFQQAGQWVLDQSPFLHHDASEEGTNVHPGFFRMMLEEKQRVPSSEVYVGQTPTAGQTSEVPAVWSVPDDLVELIDSVPGGSPSALRPPCALRLLPTSSSSSCPSQASTSRSSANSSPLSASSSASSSSPSVSSHSRPSSGSTSPQTIKRSAMKKASATTEGDSLTKKSSFQMSNPKQCSSAAMRWILESSSEYDGESGEEESSQSECEQIEGATTCRTHDFAIESTCEEGNLKQGDTAKDSTLDFSGPVGFFHRVLMDDGVRNKVTHPLPEFISLYRKRDSLSPVERRTQLRREKAKKKVCGRRSRTQPPLQGPSSDRSTKVPKHRRRHRREECLKQRLATLHRDNMSHEEYMGQFARRMSLAAVHKVFCIELTKAERSSPPNTNENTVSFNGDSSGHSALNTASPTANEIPPLSVLGRGSSPRSRAGVARPPETPFSSREKCTPGISRIVLPSPVLTIEACIANELRHRGWIMNRLLSDSHFFDLKWKLSDTDEDYRFLRREQFFNHFQNNRTITTKGGLARSFRRLAVEEQVQVDVFFPRCYHLSSLDECSDFLLDYSRCEAVTVLLAYLRCYQATPGEFHTVMVAEPLPSDSQRRSAALLVWMAYHIASIWLHELNPDKYLDRTDNIEQQGRLDPQRLEVFASHAWQFRSQTQPFLREWYATAQCGKAMCAAAHNEEALEEKTALSLVNYGELFSWSTQNLSRAPLGSQVLRLLKELQMRWPLWQLERGVFDLEDLKASEDACRPPDERVIASGESVHQSEQDMRRNGGNTMESVIRDPCWKQHNVWIMKPSSNSKASGIHCLNNPWEILKAGRGLSDRLIQKYVEQPLLLPYQTKFDMRQWVLVRSFDPLRVYMFSKLYLRLCSETYDLRDLQNRFRHVCNRHLNRLNTDTPQFCGNSTLKDTHGSATACCGTSIGKSGTAGGLDSCQPLDELESLLAKRTGNPTFFQENVMPQIRHIVLQTVRAARPFVTPRANSFELYGFDILLDATYRAWLIEVNLSPACAASADWQKQMVEQMTSGLVELLFRGDSTGALRGTGEKISRAGHWALIFDESVDPDEAVYVFPSVEPAEKLLGAVQVRGCKNPYLQFYSQPNHKKANLSFAPRAAGGTTGMVLVNSRGDEKLKNSQATVPAAASWDKMVVTGEHLPRQAEGTLDAWCRFIEAKNRIIGWWRRTAWKRRAARRKKFSLCEDIEVDYFFSLF